MSETTVARRRREREKEATQRRILDAARELFAAEGYDAVTMRAIAERIEYTPTTIYFHFRDKRDLFHRICAEDFAALAARFQVLARVPDPIERLRMLGRAYIAFAVEHPNHYRLMFLTPAPRIVPEEFPLERGNPADDAYAFLRQTVGDAMAAERFRPEYRDAELVAQTLWAGTHGVAALEIVKHDDGWVPWTPVADRIEAMVDVLLRGFVRAEA